MPRRTVTLCKPITPPEGRPKLWAYGYAALAKLLDTKEGAVRQAVCEKQFDPSDLESVMQYVAKRRGWQTNH